MSRLIDRPGDREVVFVQDLVSKVRNQSIGMVDVIACLHEGVFLLGRETGHVHPRRRFPLSHVVSLVFDRAKRDAAESALCKVKYHTNVSISRMIAYRWSFVDGESSIVECNATMGFSVI